MKKTAGVHRRVLGAVALAIIFLTAFAGIGRTGDLDVLVEGNTKFACDLYGQLAESDKGKNLFFSPLSISTALGMTYAGARAQTAAEMVKVLHFGLDPARLHPAFYNC